MRRCSFYLDGHMPEPRNVGRVTDTDSHAFFIPCWTVSLPTTKRHATMKLNLKRLFKTTLTDHLESMIYTWNYTQF